MKSTERVNGDRLTTNKAKCGCQSVTNYTIVKYLDGTNTFHRFYQCDYCKAVVGITCTIADLFKLFQEEPMFQRSMSYIWENLD